MLLLAIYVLKMHRDLQETEQLLEQCADKYYKEIHKEVTLPEVPIL